MPIFVFTLVLAVVASVSGAIGHAQGAKGIQQLWDKEKTEVAKQHLRAVERAREKEQSAQAAANTLAKEKNAKLKNLDAAYQRIAEQLRKRPARPDAGVPQSTGDRDAGRGCSVGELYRDDAEMAAAEFRRAETIRLNLMHCYARYEDVRKKLNAAQ